MHVVAQNHQIVAALNTTERVAGMALIKPLFRNAATAKKTHRSVEAGMDVRTPVSQDVATTKLSHRAVEANNIAETNAATDAGILLNEHVAVKSKNSVAIAGGDSMNNIDLLIDVRLKAKTNVGIGTTAAIKVMTIVVASKAAIHAER